MATKKAAGRPGQAAAVVGPAQGADRLVRPERYGNRRAYKASKIAIMVLAVAMPIVAEWGALAVGIAAGFILLLVASSISTMARKLDSLPLVAQSLPGRTASLQRESWTLRQAHARGGAWVLAERVAR
jgi:hypothetical protein